MSGPTFPLHSTIDENCQQGVIQSYVNIDIKDSNPTGQELSSSNVNEETAVYNEVDTSVQTHDTVNSAQKKMSIHGSGVSWNTGTQDHQACLQGPSVKVSSYTPINTDTLETNRKIYSVLQRPEGTASKPKKSFKIPSQRQFHVLALGLMANVLLSLVVCSFLASNLYALHHFGASTVTELNSLSSELSGNHNSNLQCSANNSHQHQDWLNETVFHNLLSSFQNQDFLINNPILLSHSCASIHSVSPASPSGYYWFRSPNGSFVSLYCDMELECRDESGGWTRLVQWDIADCNTQCQSADFVPKNYNGVRNCGIRPSHGPMCASTNFELPKDLVYSKVCGRVAAYASGSPDAFASTLSEVTIDSVYLDGVSLTHGSGSSRSHIWSFAACTSGSTSCSCHNSSSSRAPPAFVGSGYFCDSSGPGGSAPLWQNCSSVDLGSKTCPWFFKDLPAATSDAIELRACADQDRVDEDVAISAVEIYIQ